jgi:hypothetical protein
MVRFTLSSTSNLLSAELTHTRIPFIGTNIFALPSHLRRRQIERNDLPSEQLRNDSDDLAIKIKRLDGFQG